MPTQWLQVRGWDAPTKGLLWVAPQPHSGLLRENLAQFNALSGTFSVRTLLCSYSNACRRFYATSTGMFLCSPLRVCRKMHNSRDIFVARCLDAKSGISLPWSSLPCPEYLVRQSLLLHERPKPQTSKSELCISR